MSSFKASAILGAITLLAKANAHGIVTGILAEGVYYPGQSHYSTTPSAGWKADNGDNGFATSLTDSNIICHNNAVPGTQYVAVTAGSSIELQWTSWPDSHKGPMLDYLAPCGDDCTTVDKTALQFTKIDEAGLVDATSDPQVWASDKLIANNNTWVTTIPSSIAPGKYVLRHETIALHAAGDSNGAQAYPQCINLEVTGSGTNSLSSGTLGTELYTTTDAGILVNIYYPRLTAYDIPGPAVMAGGSSGSQPKPSASASVSASASGSAPASDAPSSSVAASTAVASNSSKTALPTSADATRSSVAVTATPTTAKAVVSSTSSAAAVTATAGGRKFVCYEEL